MCTCSTIGGMAEKTPTHGAFTALRVDGAMAEKAVRTGPRVLIVAALEGTLAPTTALILRAAANAGVDVQRARFSSRMHGSTFRPERASSTSQPWPRRSGLRPTVPMSWCWPRHRWHPWHKP
jgi:hypothetical protein